MCVVDQVVLGWLMGPLLDQLEVFKPVHSVAVLMFPLLVSSVRILALSLGPSHHQELKFAQQEWEAQAMSAAPKAQVEVWAMVVAWATEEVTKAPMEPTVPNQRVSTNSSSICPSVTLAAASNCLTHSSARSAALSVISK